MRVAVVALILNCLPIAALAQQPQPTPEALANVYRCAQTVDNTQRLACYDGAIGRLRQAESDGQLVALDRSRVETLRQESFGFSLPNLARVLPGAGGDTETIERIDVTVARIVNHTSGRHSFVMSDGQIWTQVEPRSANNIRVGDQATIRQAALGSYLLSSGRGAAHRVRREN